MDLFNAKFLEFSLLVLSIALISFWLFPKFYFSASAGKRARLRWTAIFIELIAFGLFFLMRVPQTSALGGAYGWESFFGGRWDTVLLIAFIAASFVFFLINRPALIKAGVILHALASVFVIIVLGRLAPSFVIGLSELPFVLLPLVLLSGNVFNLFWWHQLQLKAGTIPSAPDKEITIWGLSPKQKWTILAVFLVLFGSWMWQLYNQRPVVHTSEQYGYSISVPRSWDIDATFNVHPQAEFIASPDREVLIFVQRVGTPENMTDEEVLSAIREELERSPAHTVELFEEREWKGRKTIYAEGIYDGADGLWPGTYHFYEYNAFLQNRDVFTLRVNVFESSIGKFGDVARKIVTSVILPPL